MGHTEKIYLGPKDVAQQFGVSTKTVARWAVRGLLPTPAVNEGRIRRWDAAELAASLKGRK